MLEERAGHAPQASEPALAASDGLKDALLDVNARIVEERGRSSTPLIKGKTQPLPRFLASWYKIPFGLRHNAMPLHQNAAAFVMPNSRPGLGDAHPHPPRRAILRMRHYLG